jgi:AcrR family transcriptional regulator
MTTDTGKKYHHGELRSALLTAALTVLEQEGPGALSLRALARTVGVSPMAPYHHFPDRMALLAAVATVGFERLQQRKLETERVHATPLKALVAGTGNYVNFILENPNLYRLMKGPEFADRERYPELHRAASIPGATLLTLVEKVVGGRHVRQPTAQQGSLLLWGLAHGIGTLALDGQLPAGSAAKLAMEGADAMIRGWQSTD